MGTIDFTNILDPDLPQIDRSQIRPSGQQVATRAATRTMDDSGVPQGRWSDTTWPTADMAEDIIDQAVEETLADMPDYLPESTYPRVLQCVILKAAAIVEHTCYREQAEKGTAKNHEDTYEKLLASIEMVTGGAAAGHRTDSIMLRSTMSEYEPDYPLPPPRVMPKLPFIEDGSTGDEEGEL